MFYGIQSLEGYGTSLEKCVDNCPRFIKRDKKGNWIYKLEADYYYDLPRKVGVFYGEWLRIIDNKTTGKSQILIPKGYVWDGCSPNFKVLDLFYVGTPDGAVDIQTMKPKTYYASLVHDALYQYMGFHEIDRKEADEIFFKIMKRDQFYLAKAYYYGVRIFGSFFAKKPTLKKA